MGIYVNPTGRSFELAINSEIFVDKSGLIKETNKCINTLQRYMCVSRPRRFGKSMAMDMLSAYYGRKTDAENLSLFRETYHSVTSRFFSNNTCWKLIFAIHFISPTRLNKILFFYCIIMHYPV